MLVCQLLMQADVYVTELNLSTESFGGTIMRRDGKAGGEGVRRSSGAVEGVQTRLDELADLIVMNEKSSERPSYDVSLWAKSSS